MVGLGGNPAVVSKPSRVTRPDEVRLAGGTVVHDTHEEATSDASTILKKSVSVR